MGATKAGTKACSAGPIGRACVRGWSRLQVVCTTRPAAHTPARFSPASIARATTKGRRGTPGLPTEAQLRNKIDTTASAADVGESERIACCFRDHRLRSAGRIQPRDRAGALECTGSRGLSRSNRGARPHARTGQRYRRIGGPQGALSNICSCSANAKDHRRSLLASPCLTYKPRTQLRANNCTAHP